MKVYVIHEDGFTSWMEDAIADLEVFASEGLAKARIEVICRELVEERLKSVIAWDPASGYATKSITDRINGLRTGYLKPSWYDVGPVKGDDGVEVWQTAQRTVEEEVERLEAQMREVLADNRARRDGDIVKFQRQLKGEEPLEGLGDWHVVEKEVIGG